MRMTFEARVFILLGCTAAMIAALFFVPAIPQDPHYHLFADQRSLLGIPHSLDVLSNVLFLIAAIIGFKRLHRTEFGLSTAYVVFLFGLALTCFGSSYYHLQPETERLFWDRLPMTIAFMGLLSLLISLRVSPQVGRSLLWPLIIVGISSVLYWFWTEHVGIGDLRFYGLVQFGGIALCGLILLLFPGVYPRRSALIGLILGYGFAKVFESFDAQIFSLTAETISGHTLKHVVAGLGAWIFVSHVSIQD